MINPPVPPSAVIRKKWALLRCGSPRGGKACQVIQTERAMTVRLESRALSLALSGHPRSAGCFEVQRYALPQRCHPDIIASCFVTTALSSLSAMVPSAAKVCLAPRGSTTEPADNRCYRRLSKNPQNLLPF